MANAASVHVLKLEITFSYSSLAAFRTEGVCEAVLNVVVVVVLCTAYFVVIR